MPQLDQAERIAIVGIGGIFPGAPDLDTFWNNIANGVDSGRHVPAGRWYLSPEKAYAPWPPQPDRVYSTWGCFIEGFQLDPDGLDIDRELLSRLDPMFHLGLHAAREAIRDSKQLRGIDLARVGVILGNIALPTESTSAMCRDVLGRTFVEKLIDAAPLTPERRNELKSSLTRSHWHALNRYAVGLPSSLIAQALGLGGTAYTLDAACASSLYALKFASEELLAGRADAMLAGGMSRPDCLYTQMGFAQLQALSKNGRCAPLSSEADGLVVGEGAGVFVLKRLSDAVAAGDHIYGVIAGIGLSNDQGANLLAPQSEGQLRAMTSAYDQAGWKPSDVDLIECHATGTPVGDAVEIASLHQFWQHESARPRQCVIGGVKSNVGHLLTGAGAAGLMKVLFSLKHHTLPPTANFIRPAPSLDVATSPFRVLSQSEPWPERVEGLNEASAHIPRRAAINAFGFGGINAHVLIEEWQTSRAEARRTRGGGEGFATRLSANDSPIAIIGLAAHIGSSDTERPFRSNDWTRSDELLVAPPNWWGVEQSAWIHREHPQFPGNSVPSRSNFISEIRLAFGEFRIPPREMRDMLPQQQLMLKVAAAALRDAAKPSVESKNEVSPQDSAQASNTRPSILDAARIGVFVGISLDPNNTNYHFRWSVEEDAPRWAEMLELQLAPDELATWIEALKEAAGRSLVANRVMGNLGGVVASRLAREFEVGGPSFTVASGGESAEDAFRLAVQSLQRGELDQALVGAVELSSDIRAMLAARNNFDRDGAVAFVLKRLDDAQAAGDRIYAVVSGIEERRISPNADQRARPFIERAATFSAQNLMHWILGLYRGVITKPNGSTFWLRNRVEGGRSPVAPRWLTNDRSVSAWLEEVEQPLTPLVEREHREFRGELPAGLFIVDGDSHDELAAGLEQLAARMDSSLSAEHFAKLWFLERPPQENRHLAIALVVRQVDELRDAIRAGQARLRGDAANARDRRVFFSAKPLARSGRVAFVFPGSGNHFLGMGRELLATFPEVLHRQDAENERLRDQYRPDLIWHGRSTAAMANDHKSMIFSQVAIGTAVCDLLALFSVRPSASIGYSLGESAALFGLRTWTDRDEMLERMQQSPLFGSDLVAPFDAARQVWEVPDDENVQWLSGVIDRSADEVRETIAAHSAAAGTEPRVYLLIVNTPTQCVIGGDRTEVERVVRDLSAAFVPFGSPSTVHCKVLRNVEAAYRELHLMRTTPPADIDFYSTAWGRKYDLAHESTAEAIVAQAVETIDFPRVIERAYADGVRLFVEIGPGSSCTRMIDEILANQPHFARAALPATSDPVGNLLELFAALITERVPVNLSYLYGESSDAVPTETPNSNPREVITRIGGLPFEIPSPPGGWRADLSRVAPSEIGWAEPSDPVIDDSDTIDGSETDVIGITTLVADDLDDHIESVNHEESIVPTDEANLVFASPQSLNPQLSTLNLLQQMTNQRQQAHESFLRFSARAELLAAEHLAALSQAGVATQVEAMVPDATAQSKAVDLGAFQWETMPALVPSPPPSGERARVRGPSGENAFDTAFPSDGRGPHPLPSKARGEGTGEEPLFTRPSALGPRLTPPRSLNRDECMTFAIGKIGDVLGTMFADIDKHPTRVRLPDEPLMLVDRILSIEGEPLSMTSGRVVTEHDIHPGAWYLDCGRIPTCIAVESGQADLFLSGWLGIDFETKGLASYRLLDAVVTFHDELPQAGKTIHYDIRVLHFFRQGQTYLFRFEFDATVDGRPLLTMREGCAGFFTEAELAGGKGIIHTALDKRPRPGKRSADWSDPVPMAVERYDDSQLLALRHGDLAACFGPAFSGLPLREPVTIPGLANVGGTLRMPSAPRSESAGDIEQVSYRSRMWLIDRVLKLDPVGGKFGMGTILGELDIHPNDWFLTCHFCDDQVMPGTLMYECCMHTLRIFLLRMGWVGEAGQIVYEPIIEVRSRLKCRGQVLSSTKKVWYEVTLKEVGYGQDAYCLADALMYADGKPIVEITDMSVRLTGLSRVKVERLWSGSQGSGVRSQESERKLTDTAPASSSSLTPVLCPLTPSSYDLRPAIFNTDRITAFAIGKPSEAFGDRYRVFDDERKIARLPGPPFQFLDRVVSIENCQPWKLEAGGEIVAQYDIPVDAWYFAANRQPTMPFAVLLETALQPCGWLAGYLGSALTSETDLSFRNLGGKAIQYREVTPQSGTLTTKVKITKVSQSGGMIIQNFDYDLSCNGEPVYVGDTYFGFFSKESLVNQVGIRDAKVFVPSLDESARASRFDSPDAAPFANSEFQMVDNAELLLDGGPHGLGFVRGTMRVDPSVWFFKAHFYQDPVVPGSLGLESFFQLMKFYAATRWRLGQNAVFQTPSLAVQPATQKPTPHEWVYRGQVIPCDELVTVTAVIRSVDDTARQLTAEGFLSIDGRVIYQMKMFTLSVT